MKVAFLSIGSSSFESYYGAFIKPFIDLAQGLALEGHETLNITLNVAESAVIELQKGFPNRIFPTYSMIDARHIL